MFRFYRIILMQIMHIKKAPHIDSEGLLHMQTDYTKRFLVKGLRHVLFSKGDAAVCGIVKG